MRNDLGTYRQLVSQLIGLAVMGSAAAVAAKLLGVEKSTFSTAVGGALVGWCCCWLYTGWINTTETRTRQSNDARLTRAAQQRTEIDNSIKITMPAHEKFAPEKKV